MSRARLLLGLCGAVCALLLAEGAARLHGDVLCTDTPGAVFQADARFGWSFVPGASGIVGSCAGSPVPWARLAVDSHGLAQPERPYEKSPDTVRVLLLGGNLAAGLGVPPEATFARLLETFADAHRGPRLEVVNGGTGGFALDNDLLWFRHEGRRYAPDVVVVVLEAPGELVAISPEAIAARGQRAPLKPFFRLEDGRAVERTAYAAAAVDPPPPLPGNAFLRSFQLYRNAHRIPSRSGPPMEWADIPLPSGEQADAANQGTRALGTALLAALRDETAAAGARLVALVAPQGGTPRRGLGWQARTVLMEITAELGIPTIDPAAVFSIVEDGREIYLPGTGRWSAAGHTQAAFEVWRFLHDGGFVPSLVPASFLAPTTVSSARELPGALVRALYEARWSRPVQFVVYGLLAVCVLWMFAPADPAGREWMLVALSVVVLAALIGSRTIGGAVAFALVSYAVVERLPGAVGAVVLALLSAALVLATVALRPEHVSGEDPYLVVLLALAGNVALLRLIAYAFDRARGAPRQPLRSFLLTLFYFPTFPAGPVESPHAFARRAAAAAVDAGRQDALAPVRAAPHALLRLALGALELGLAVVVVNKIGTEVFATGGAAVGRARLWLWVGELTASFTLLLAGWTDVVLALGTLAGIRPMENFDAPWRATDVADFWRRWHVSVGRWLHDYVYLPIRGAGQPAAVAVLAVFAVSAAWAVWGLLKIIGFHHYRPPSWTGVFLWALLNAVAVILTRRRNASPTLAPLRTALTLVVVSLLWVPFFIPGWETAAAAVPVYLRLFFLR